MTSADVEVALAGRQKGLAEENWCASAGVERGGEPQGLLQWDAAALVARGACIGVPADRNVLVLLKQEETVGGYHNRINTR